MADNVQFQSNQLATPASGTTVSTDDTPSGHVQRVKIAYSADGSDVLVEADANGLRVNNGAHLDALSVHMDNADVGLATKSAIYGFNSGGAGSFEPVKVTPSGALTVEIDDGGGSITVDGTVAATQSGSWSVAVSGELPLPTGAATEHSLALLGSNLSTVTNGSNIRVLGLVDARQSGPFTVGGTVGVSGTVLVDGSAKTQPVSGTVTVQDGGSSLTVDGTVAATQSGSWTVGVGGTVTVDGSGVTQPVSGTVTATDGGGSLTVDGTVSAAQSGTWNIANVTGTVSLPTGAATETSLSAISATASGSNLRVIESDPLPVRSSLAAVGSIAASASSVILLAANANRRAFAVFNDSTATLYLKFGATASTSSYTVQIDASGYYESGPVVYSGRLDAIWSSATGAARVTEW